MVRRMKSEVRRKAEALWRQWVRGLPLDPMLNRLGLTYSQAVRLIARYIKERSRELEELGVEAKVERVVGAYEEMEIILWQQIQVFLHRWQEAMGTGDEKTATRYSHLLKELLELLSTITTRKAEMMRRLGVLPTAVERATHLVGIVQATQTLNDFSSIIPRLPIKAPTALPETEPNPTSNIDVDATVDKTLTVNEID